MIVCGLKITHDSAIALFDGNKLLFSVELEKVRNNNRYKILDDLIVIEEVLASGGFSIRDVDRFVVDGWVGLQPAAIKRRNDRVEVSLTLAPYHDSASYPHLLERFNGCSVQVGSANIPYASYMHAAGHFFGSYCTSPFSQNGENSFVLIWDGGMYPTLYHYEYASGCIVNLGALFHLGTNVYSIFSQHFGPFRINENVIKDELSIAGKVMAYIALGNYVPEIEADLRQAYKLMMLEGCNNSDIPHKPYRFAEIFRENTDMKGYVDEDILTSFHIFIENMLLENLSELVDRSGIECANICFTGGAALNIKWNSAIRKSGLFENVWVCPFPNDSGSAIGAACCELVVNSTYRHIEWDVYSGPPLVQNEPADGWSSRELSVEELAALLHDSQEPVMVLNSRSELGPRSLGNRSILSAAGVPGMKDVLNQMKYREPYRPVAPVCLEEYSQDIFYPGGKDPYMLFDHAVKPEWREKIPAVCHVDGSARLQTVSGDSNGIIYDLLKHYASRTGIPVLCNTSANLKGCGFFPDIYSATRWNKVNYVWSDGVLYEKVDKINFRI